MRIFDRIREYLRRRNDLSAGRDPVWDDAPQPQEQAPTVTLPAYEPHGIDTPATLAEIVAQAAQEFAQTEARGEPATPAPHVPAAHEPPPMPPSSLSRIMVAQIPSPPPNDRNFEWTHKYADYMRRVGVATGTSTDLEHTMAWGIPALKPGDGTGVELAAQEHGETGPEVAA